MRGGHRRRERREQALERQDLRDARSNSDQLARLEAAGHGQCREAQDLRRYIAKET